MYRLDAWRRSGRDVSMRDRHVTETEMTQALQRALLHATDEVVGDKRAISADVYCDCLVGLFLAASPQPENAGGDRAVGRSVPRQAHGGAGSALRRRARVSEQTNNEILLRAAKVARHRIFTLSDCGQRRTFLLV
jgi:hypothetical protein